MKEAVTALADKILKIALKNKSNFKRYDNMHHNNNWLYNRSILTQHSQLTSIAEVRTLKIEILRYLLKVLMEQKCWPMTHLTKILNATKCPISVFKWAWKQNFQSYGDSRDKITDLFEIFCRLGHSKLIRYVCRMGNIKFVNEHNIIDDRYYIHGSMMDHGIYYNNIYIFSPIVMNIINRRYTSVTLNMFEISSTKDKILIDELPEIIKLRKKLFADVIRIFAGKNLSKLIDYYT